MWIIKNLVPEVRALTQDNVSSSALEPLSKRALELLKYISDQWKRHTISVAITKDIMMYLDRVYIQETRTDPLGELLEGSFRDNLLYYPIGSPKSEARVINLLFDVMFRLISLLRNGQCVDKKLMRSCVGLLKSLHGTEERTEDNNLYKIDFKPLFIADSKDFFVKEAKSLAQQSATIWLQRTNYWLKEEGELCRTVIWGPTYHAMIKIVESQLI
jgi:cullin 3